MINVRPLENILDSGTKIAILRVLSSRADRRLGGSEIARMAGFSAPSTHAALKVLHAARVVTMELLGNQHVYVLNHTDRIVQKIILQMFRVEADWKKDLKERIIKGLKESGSMQSIVSLILHGSIQRGDPKPGCDLDLAVIVRGAGDLGKVKEVFLGAIYSDIEAYFGLKLDAYIKTAEEFGAMLKRKSPVTAEVMKTHSVLYGKDPLELG